MNDSVSRRDFLTTSTAAATVAAVRPAKADGVNGRINLALIGCGGMGHGHVKSVVSAKHNAHFAWLCDVDRTQIDRVTQSIGNFQKTPPKRTSRFEDVVADKSVDAVIIATPHHWHAPIALAAIQSGKDIYVEKPMSHVFAEGQLIIEAAKKHNRVVQQGSQMRSSPVTAAAGKLLSEGIIGEIKVAKAWNVQQRGTRKVVPDTTPPTHVDYNRWLGPAPVRGFNVNRFHGNWRIYQDYGNGDIGDDGIHDLDMARWGLGVTTHPSRITAHGGDTFYRGANKGDREFPDNMMVTYEYADGRVLIYEDRLFTPYGLHGYDSGNAFYGTKGYMIFSRRGAFNVYFRGDKPGPKEPPGTRTKRGHAEHWTNFLEAVRSRDPNTNASAQIAHLSCGLVHLGEIAFRTRGALDFDPQREQFLDCPEANELLTKKYRQPYGLPALT